MMMKRLSTTLITGLALVGMASLASAHDYKAGQIVVHHPYAIETPPMVKAGGGYMTLVNNGTEDDALLEVKADFPQVMLHKTEIKDGVASMPHMHKIDIAAGQTVSLEPGGFHIMFMGLDGDPFEEGERIPATLVFEKAGPVDVEFMVQKRNASATDMKMDHSDHSGHSGHSDGAGDAGDTMSSSDPHSAHKHN